MTAQRALAFLAGVAWPVRTGIARTRLTATSLVDSMEARDAMMTSGMDVGIREGYEKLDELLAR